MKKSTKLTEKNIRKIVKESINKILKEENYNNANDIIDSIGMEIEPIAKKMSELKFIYGELIDKHLNNGEDDNFFINFAKAFNNAVNALETMEYIYNH